jgi:hypothetical protein
MRLELIAGGSSGLGRTMPLEPTAGLGVTPGLELIDHWLARATALEGALVSRFSDDTATATVRPTIAIDTKASGLRTSW